MAKLPVDKQISLSEEETLSEVDKLNAEFDRLSNPIREVAPEISTIVELEKNNSEVQERATVNQKLIFGEQEIKSCTDYKAIAEELIQIPYKFRELSNKVAALARKQDAQEKKLTEIKNTTFASVCNDSDAEGKKKFTNEKMRDIETEKRISENVEYQAIKEEELSTITKMQEAKTELDFLKQQLKVFEILPEYTKRL